jgi:hypothetical protein
VALLSEGAVFALLRFAFGVAGSAAAVAAVVRGARGGGVRLVVAFPSASSAFAFASAALAAGPGRVVSVGRAQRRWFVVVWSRRSAAWVARGSGAALARSRSLPSVLWR